MAYSGLFFLKVGKMSWISVTIYSSHISHVICSSTSTICASQKFQCNVTCVRRYMQHLQRDFRRKVQGLMMLCICGVSLFLWLNNQRLCFFLESMKGMLVEKKDTKIDNLNETVLQLINILSKQSGNISHLEAGLNRIIVSLKQLDEKILRETMKREKTIEDVKKQLTFEIANQNTNVSYLHEESIRLDRRVKLLQQNFTAVKKGIEAERLEREKSLHNVTKQLRQNMANHNVATTKEIWLLASNVSKLFQETIINRKLLSHESYNITKQVKFLRQKHTTLDHINKIVQQNLTELLNETLSLKATDIHFRSS